LTSFPARPILKTKMPRGGLPCGQEPACSGASERHAACGLACRFVFSRRHGAAGEGKDGTPTPIPMRRSNGGLGADQQDREGPALRGGAGSLPLPLVLGHRPRRERHPPRPLPRRELVLRLRFLPPSWDLRPHHGPGAGAGGDPQGSPFDILPSPAYTKNKDAKRGPPLRAGTCMFRRIRTARGLRAGVPFCFLPETWSGR
jgi:hypothetical protein